MTYVNPKKPGRAHEFPCFGRFPISAEDSHRKLDRHENLHIVVFSLTVMLNLCPHLNEMGFHPRHQCPRRGEGCNTIEYYYMDIRSQYPVGVVWGGKEREEKAVFSWFCWG